MSDIVDSFIQQRASQRPALPPATPSASIIHAASEPVPSQEYIEGMRAIRREEAEAHRADVEARREERAAERAAIEAYRHGDPTGAVPHFKTPQPEDAPFYDSRVEAAERSERYRERLWDCDEDEQPAAAASEGRAADDDTAAASDSLPAEPAASRRGRR